MLKHALRDATRFHWSEARVRAALPCTITVALSLLVGLVIGRPVIGMIAAGGAMSVGFGTFQTLGRSRWAPMFWASIGMSLATLAGSLAPHTATGLLCHGVAVGFVYGLLTSLGPGAAWITLQCAIAAFISTAYPSGLAHAMGRALLVLAGGSLQMGMVLFFRRLHEHFHAEASYEDPFDGVLPAMRILRDHLHWASREFRYALQLAGTLGLGAGGAYALGLTNGYWVPMTALFVLRTDLRETFSRGVARVVGTLVGAGLATLLAGGLRPGEIALSALVVLCAWLCYSVVNVNYGVFSVCVTAYIVFILSFAGLPQPHVAWHRVVNTALGGALALVVAVPEMFLPKRHRPLGAAQP